MLKDSHAVENSSSLFNFTAIFQGLPFDKPIKFPQGPEGPEGTDITPINKPPPRENEPLPTLILPDVESHLNSSERAFMTSDQNRRKYHEFRFDQPQGDLKEDMNFNDSVQLLEAAVPVTWPKRLQLRFFKRDDTATLGLVELSYEQMRLTHGTASDDHDHSDLLMDFEGDERIIEMEMAKGMAKGDHKESDVEGIVFVQVTTSKGQAKSIGDKAGAGDSHSYKLPEGCKGLKGFYGCAGDIVDRIGLIWG